MPSAYRFSEFVASCANHAAFVTRGALLTAQNDFKLRTQKEVLDFIAAGGLERLAYTNTRPWANNPDKTRVVMIDAYRFFSGSVQGYLAFGFMNTGKWMVKSFKKSFYRNSLTSC